MAQGTLHNFPKAEKLKSRKQIDLLFREGKSFFAAPVKCYFRLTSLQVGKLEGLQVDEFVIPNPDGYRDQTTNYKPQTTNHKPQTTNLKSGFTASKRNFKKATDRNRIKRLLREAYRIHKSPLQEKLQAQQKQLEVFFVFTDKALPKFDLIEEKMKYCIRRLGKIVEGGL